MAKKRIQLELSETTYERMRKLKDRMDVTSYTDVVKDALRLLDAVVTEHENGREFFVKDKEGNISEYKILSVG